MPVTSRCTAGRLEDLRAQDGAGVRGGAVRGTPAAGPAESYEKMVGDFSRHPGRRLQILNDLKDWETDSDNKLVAGQDAFAGRPTLLLALALEGLDTGDRQELLGLLNRAAPKEQARPEAIDQAPSTMCAGCSTRPRSSTRLPNWSKNIAPAPRPSPMTCNPPSFANFCTSSWTACSIEIPPPPSRKMSHGPANGMSMAEKAGPPI